MNWKDSYLISFHSLHYCTIIGKIVGSILIAVGVTLLMLISWIFWTTIAIIGFIYLTTSRIFIKYDYTDNIASMCLWWWDKLEQGFPENNDRTFIGIN